MAKSKNKTEQQSSSNWTANYSQIAPQETADTQAIRDWKPQSDPSIGYAYSRALGNIRNSFGNPLGADTPASVREAIERNAYGELGQQEAQTRSEEAFRNNMVNLEKLQYLDQRTRPQLVQSGGAGNSTGSTVQTQHATPFGIASNVAGAFLF